MTRFIPAIFMASVFVAGALCNALAGAPLFQTTAISAATLMVFGYVGTCLHLPLWRLVATVPLAAAAATVSFYDGAAVWVIFTDPHVYWDGIHYSSLFLLAVLTLGLGLSLTALRTPFKMWKD